MEICVLRKVNDHGIHYLAFVFVCPGCAQFGQSGLHMLPVNSSTKTPSWYFNNDFVKPTLSPPIKTTTHRGDVCHSFLENGTLRFLEDSTHCFAGQTVPLPELEEWMKKL